MIPVVRVEMFGISKLIASVEGMKERSLNFTSPLIKAGQLMLSSVQQNFKEQGRPFAWTPLSEAYLKRKLAQGYSSNILQRTGVLMSSIVPLVSRNKLQIGTAVPYAKYHQEEFRKRPRQFLKFQKQDKEDIKTLLLRYVTKGS